MSRPPVTREVEEAREPGDRDEPVGVAWPPGPEAEAAPTRGTRRRRVPGYAVAAFLVGAFTVQLGLSVPGPGFDSSWVAALHMAEHEGLQFGSNLVYTYGPLGFLSQPRMLYPGTAALGVLTVLATYFGTLGVVARALTRELGIAAGAVLLFLLARMAVGRIGLAELASALLLLLCATVALDPARRLGPAPAAGMGALAGSMALVKPGTGTLQLALLLLVLALPVLKARADRSEGLRVAAAGLLGYLVTLVGLWLATGQTLFDLPLYVERGLSLATGFGDAAQLEDPARAWEYGAAAAGVLALAGLLFVAVRSLPRENGAVLVGLYAVFLLVLFRQGFIRHDGHSINFFAPALLSVVPLVRRGRLLLVLLVAIPFGLGCMSQRDPIELVRASDTALVDTVDTLLSPARQEALRASGRDRLKAAYRLRPEVLADLRGATVHIDPAEAALAWAYPSIEWRPAPVFQNRAAWTAKLDSLNAEFLTGERAPRFILRAPGALDERSPRFESPAYIVELVCRYEPYAFAGGAWLVTLRGPDRCGEERRLSERRLSFGERAAVPAADRDDLVVATFTDIDEPLSQRLAKLALKPRVMHIGVGRGMIYRFLPGHAENPHLLKLPGCIGHDPTFEDVPYDSVRLSLDRDSLMREPAPQPGSYTLTFFRIPYHCPPG